MSAVHPLTKSIALRQTSLRQIQVGEAAPGAPQAMQTPFTVQPSGTAFATYGTGCSQAINFY